MTPDSTSSNLEIVHPYFNWENIDFSALTGNKSEFDLNQQISESLFPASGISLSEVPHVTFQHDWMAWVLLGLLFGISLIWYFVPERLLSILNFPSDRITKRQKDSGYNSPGFLISFFLSINYLITFSLFIFLLVKKITLVSIKNIPDLTLLFYIPVLILIFYLFRLIFIRLNGFLFKTNAVSKQQHLIYLNVDNLMGIILIPVILLSMYSSANIFILVGFSIIVVIHLFRWLQTFILGKSIAGFSVLHLFMYLCTLEIIPLLVLIKLLRSGVI